MRLFIAAPVPELIRLQIEAAAAPLHSALPSASWTRADSFHLTFAFLGEHEGSVVEPLSGRLDETLRTAASFSVSLGEPGFFPNERRPRVAWIGLNPRQPLIDLAEKVRGAVTAQNVSFDQKPYVPHLTLARLRERWNAAAAAKYLRALTELEPVRAELTTVILFESQLSSRGAIHTPLHRVELSR